jgi:hypothetical protein
MTTATMSPPATEPMLLDWVLPEFDATLVEHRLIEADPETVYEAVKAVDLGSIARGNPAIRALFATRAAAERVISTLTNRPGPAVVSDAPIRLGDLPEHGEWVRLGEDPPRELTFGVIGRFWAGETVWKTIDADRFVAFDRPGFAKIACSVTVRPYGGLRSLVTYEARTLGLDPESSAKFLRYWRLVWPGVAIVMRAYLRAVAEEVR